MKKIILTVKELKELGKEISETSKEMFLVKRKIIKLGKGGEWIVMQYEGLKGTKVAELEGYLYESDIPFDFWNIALSQVDNYLRRREQWKKEHEGSHIEVQ